MGFFPSIAWGLLRFPQGICRLQRNLLLLEPYDLSEGSNSKNTKGEKTRKKE
jgi:hypothetical protein